MTVKKKVVKPKAKAKPKAKVKPKAKAKAEPKAKPKMGRPTGYNKELGERICQAVSVSSSGLEIICEENDGFPNAKTIYAWRHKHPEFSKEYEIAKANQAKFLAEEILEIADNGVNDWMKRNAEDNEGYRANGEHIQRSRLRVDARKWIVSKLLPKVYGDKVISEQKVTVTHEQQLKDLE